MQSTPLNDLVTATGKLATLPSTVIELLKLLSDSTAGASQVQKVLETDPAMTANVLKISNSAFYGVRREIASVRDALVMLGNRRTATLALATSMASVLRRDLLGYGLGRQEFWDHSLRSAAASAAVSGRLGLHNLQCEAFTSGLLHDVGKMVLDPVLQDNDETPLSGQENTWEICQIEEKIMGFNHCQAGALLARQWGFPEVLIEPIASHHVYDSSISSRGAVKAVTVGNLVADAVQWSEDDPRLKQVEVYLQDLGMEPDVLNELRLDLSGDLSEICGAATTLVSL